MKNIVLITDVWGDKNTNGVVTYLTNIVKGLENKGFNVIAIHPSHFGHFSLPTYPEIKMAFLTRKRLEAVINKAQPDYIHIATEGTLGFIARSVCVRNNWQFTTYYHTRLPEYVQMRLKMLEKTTYRYLRWFHNKSSCVMVSTMEMKRELLDKNFKNMAVSPYAVNTDLFHPYPPVKAWDNISRPIFLFLGRLAPEKNIPDFLDCDLPGTKIVIGDGPDREKLERAYAGKAIFTGYKKGVELASMLSSADVFVFPSVEDTFGMTIIEALACGVPVAAYNVRGPKDILTSGHDGYIGDDLGQNALKCLDINKLNCIKTAQKYSWDQAVSKFIDNLISIN